MTFWEETKICKLELVSETEAKGFLVFCLFLMGVDVIVSCKAGKKKMQGARDKRSFKILSNDELES